MFLMFAYRVHVKLWNMNTRSRLILVLTYALNRQLKRVGNVISIYISNSSEIYFNTAHLILENWQFIFVVYTEKFLFFFHKFLRLNMWLRPSCFFQSALKPQTGTGSSN